MRARTPEDHALLEAFDPIAESLGLAIVRVRLMGASRSDGARKLQIMAERLVDKDINVNECARLSRALSVYLDEVDPIEGEFVLEVSSPGIDRPLTRLEDFIAYEGFEARLELDRVAEGRKRFRGFLVGLDEGHVAIDLDGEEETTLVPFDWIVEAKLVLNDALLAHGEELRRQKLLEQGLSLDDEISDDLTQDEDEKA